MLLSLLNTKSNGYDGELSRDYWALYRGGKKFRERVSRFLSKRFKEPEDIYRERCDASYYTCYLGQIVDYFAAHLFSSEAKYEARRDGRETTPPEYYGEFFKDADGTGQDFKTWLQDRWKRAIVKGADYWLLEFPDGNGTEPETRAAWEQAGLGDLKLRAFSREHLFDFKRDQRGRLEWAIFHSEEISRKLPSDKDRTVTHRYWVCDRQQVAHHAVEWSEKDPPDDDVDVPQLWSVEHNLGAVPVVELLPPVGLWVGDRVSAPQKEHFAISSAQNWNIRQSCYAMPVFKREDPTKPLPLMGAAYYLSCGVNEGLDWASPPTDVFSVTQLEKASLKDEIYRIVTQMAQGVNNNAAAIGRSGESKLADAKSEEIILTAYGAALREAEQSVLNLLSRYRKDNVEWEVTGRDVFKTIDPLTLTEIGQDAALIGLNSRTFRTELLSRIAIGILPGLTADKREAILEEIATDVAEHPEGPDEEAPESGRRGPAQGAANAVRARASSGRA